MMLFVKRTSDGSIHFQKVRFVPQDIGRSLNDEEGLFLRQSTLAIEVVFKESNVRFAGVDRGKELFVGWGMRRRGLNLHERMFECK